MSILTWLVLAIGVGLVVGWTVYYTRKTWIPEWKERKRQEEVMRRGRGNG